MRRRKHRPDRVLKNIERKREWHPSGLTRRARYTAAAAVVVVTLGIVTGIILILIHAHG